MLNYEFNHDDRMLLNGVKIQAEKLYGSVPGTFSHSKDIVMAGGVFCGLINSQPYEDIDVFFLRPALDTVYKTMHERSLAVVKQNSPYTEKTRILEVFNSFGTTTYQYIFTDYDSREELLEDFDYLHCCVSYCNKNLYVSPKVYRAIRTNTLIVSNPSKVTEERRKKFLQRGWKDYAPEPEIPLSPLTTTIWDTPKAGEANSIEAIAKQLSDIAKEYTIPLVKREPLEQSLHKDDLEYYFSLYSYMTSMEYGMRPQFAAAASSVVKCSYGYDPMYEVEHIVRSAARSYTEKFLVPNKQVITGTSKELSYMIKFVDMMNEIMSKFSITAQSGIKSQTTSMLNARKAIGNMIK